MDETNSTASSVLEETNVAMSRLRRALVAVMASADADPTQPQELSRQFDLDKTLTWKIARVIREDSAAQAVVHVPGRRRIEAFLRAMEKGGAPRDAVEEAMRAYQDFERVVEVHSGDRGTLDVLVAGASKGSARRLEVIRKNGFLANAAVWGVRAKAHLGIHMVAPSGEGDLLDAITLCGFLGFHRLRQDQSWAIANAISFDLPDRGIEAPAPLHPDGLINEGPLLPQFCSAPLPSVRTVKVDKTNWRYELPPGPIGQSSAVDVILGWRWPRDMSARASHAGDYGEHGMHLSTPAEMSVLELWVHRSLAFAIPPTARVYSELPSGPRYPREGREAGTLPIPGDVADLGLGAEAGVTPEFPRGAELLRFAAGRMGWNMDEFHGFRFRLRYPPIPTAAMLQHDLLPWRGS